MKNLTLFPDESAIAVATPEVIDPLALLKRDTIVPLCEEFDELKIRSLALRDSCPRINRIQYSSVSDNLNKMLIEAHSRVCQEVKNKAATFLNSEGIENLQLPNPDLDRYDLSKSEAPLDYWNRMIAMRDELMVEGVRKHGKVLNNELFGWDYANSNTVKMQKTCAVVSVGAHEDDNSWSKGYTSCSQDSLRKLLDSLRYVASTCGIDSFFSTRSCMLAFGELFEAGAKVDFCDDCQMVTNKNGVKVRLSFKFLEVIQVFLAEQGFEAPQGG